MAINTMQAQAANAQNNPNIISDITGAPSQTSLQPAPSTPAPASPSPAQALGSQASSIVPSLGNAQNVAVGMANEMYGSQFVPGMESQRNAMMTELGDYDNMLSKIYEGGSYFPKKEGYVDNPADMFRAIAGVSGQTGSDISRTAATIDSTERAYNMAISAVMDRFMDFYKMQEDQKRWEKQFELEQAKSGLAGNDDEKDRQALAILFGADPNAIATGDPMAVLSSAAQSQTGPTLQTLKLASLHNPKGIAKYQQMYSTYNPSSGQMSSANEQALLGSKATLRNLEDLWSLYRQIPGIQKGRFGQGQIGNLFGPLSGENLAAQFDELRMSIATNIARNMYGEKGMVSDKDIERIAASLPSRYESEEKSAQKFTRMRNNILAGMQDITGTAGGMNTMAGGMNPIYSQPSFMEPQTAVAGDVSTMTDEIPVEELRSGMRGWIPKSEFDPNIYKRL